MMLRFSEEEDRLTPTTIPVLCNQLKGSIYFTPPNADTIVIEITDKEEAEPYLEVPWQIISGPASVYHAPLVYPYSGRILIWTERRSIDHHLIRSCLGDEVTLSHGLTHLFHRLDLAKPESIPIGAIIEDDDDDEYSIHPEIIRLSL